MLWGWTPSPQVNSDEPGQESLIQVRSLLSGVLAQVGWE